MSPRVPEAYLEARRTEIIEAAFKCFMEKGFRNTTMQDIYRATNLSPGAVYNYFSSKEDIVTATVKQFSDWSLSSIVPLITQNPDESFINIFKHWLDSIKDSDVSGFSVQLDFYSETIRNKEIREAIRKSQDATHSKLVQIIKENQESGGISAKLDPQAIARVFVGMVFVLGIHKIIEPDVDAEAYEEVCEAMLTGTFATPPMKRRRL